MNAGKGKYLKRINDQIVTFRMGFTNDFLITLSDGYLLIDTGYYHKFDQFVAELKKAEIDLEEIRFLLLTHHHDDHVGFAREFLLKSPAKLIVHKNALPFLGLGIHDGRGEHWNHWVHRMLSPLSKVLNHQFPRLHVREDDVIIANGYSKALRKIGLEADLISTPGHSSDSTSIVTDDGVAIVGDTAMNLLNLGETRYLPFFIQDIEELFRSWRKLVSFGTKYVYPSHGRPFVVEKLIGELRVSNRSGYCG